MIIYSLSNLRNDFVSNCDAWKSFCKCCNPMSCLPEPYNNVNELTQLVIFKCLRPDALIVKINELVNDFYGETISKGQNNGLECAFEKSTSKTPLIVLKSKGYNASINILRFAEEQNAVDRYFAMAF